MEEFIECQKQRRNENNWEMDKFFFPYGKMIIRRSSVAWTGVEISRSEQHQKEHKSHRCALGSKSSYCSGWKSGGLWSFLFLLLVGPISTSPLAELLAFAKRCLWPSTFVQEVSVSIERRPLEHLNQSLNSRRKSEDIEQYKVKIAAFLTSALKSRRSPILM